MKTGIVALLLVVAAPALADPLPAGKCSLVDNGVAHAAPPPEIRGQEADPHILAMAFPKSVLRHDGAIVDIALRIEADGAVAAPRILCTSWNGAGIENDLLAAALNWRFSPMMRGGNAIAAEAAYRIVIGGGVTPLSFMPRQVLRKIEG